MTSQDRDRVLALSLQLAQAHDELRGRIRLLRASLGERRRSRVLAEPSTPDATLGERRRSRVLAEPSTPDATPGERADGATLVAHCLAFCAALTSHHRGEDTGMFADLLRVRPDLAGTVSKLVEDHELVASILSRIAQLADDATRSHGTALEAIGRELDGLAALMESHFAYEQRAIGGALDTAARDTTWHDTVFRFLC